MGPEHVTLAVHYEMTACVGAVYIGYYVCDFCTVGACYHHSAFCVDPRLLVPYELGQTSCDMICSCCATKVSGGDQPPAWHASRRPNCWWWSQSKGCGSILAQLTQ